MEVSVALWQHPCLAALGVAPERDQFFPLGQMRLQVPRSCSAAGAVGVSCNWPSLERLLAGHIAEPAMLRQACSGLGV